MDGLQGKIAPSLQLRLSAGLALVIVVVALVAGVFSFVSAFRDAIELQDDQLRQMAALTNRQRLSVTVMEPQEDVPDSDPEYHVVVRLLRPSGSEGPEPDGELPGLSENLSDGFQTVTIPPLSWRLYVKTLDSGSRIAVGQQTAARDEIARDGALRTLMPFLILVPILLLVVGDLIRKMFKPLKRIASDIDRRSDQDLREIPETHLPSEIRPFVVAINRLLLRVAQSMTVQRRFVADAAHELRSPLTALSLQVEGLEIADMSDQARVRLASVRNGIQRTRSLLDQLLTLARVQDSTHGQPAMVSVQQVFRQVLEDLMPLTEAKNLDVGVVSAEDAHVMTQAADMKTLVKNIVDNAIRYTPDGGRINLSVQTSESSVILQVDDTGPGIAEDERERVFDPFYRVLGHDEMGSGLGLSIVQTIANRIGASVSLDYSSPQAKSGLCVKVTFPLSGSRTQDHCGPSA